MGSNQSIQPYIIQSGDTFSKIAEKYGLTTDELLTLNPELKDPNKIKQGGSLNIPIVKDSSIDKPVDSFVKTTSSSTPKADKAKEPWQNLQDLIDNGKNKDSKGAKITEEKGFLGIKTGTILYTADGSMTYGELKQQLNIAKGVITDRNPEILNKIKGYADDAIIPAGTVLKFKLADLPGKPLTDKNGKEVPGFSKSLFDNTILYTVQSDDKRGATGIYEKFKEYKDLLKDNVTAGAFNGYSEYTLQPGTQVPLFEKNWFEKLFS